MEDIERNSENVQEVAEPETVENVQGTETDVEKAVETAEPQVEPQKVERDYERDNAFKTMRKQVEDSAKQIEQKDAEINRLLAVCKQYNLQGDNVEEIEDFANAYVSGRDVADIRAERIKAQEEKTRQDEMQEELDMYRQKEIEQRMQNDLEEIQKINPEVKSLEELGNEFCDLIKKGIKGVDAYMLLDVKGMYDKKNVQAEQQALKKIKANAEASVGALQSQANTDKGYKDMSAEDFEKVIMQAKRGELRSS